MVYSLPRKKVWHVLVLAKQLERDYSLGFARREHREQSMPRSLQQCRKCEPQSRTHDEKVADQKNQLRLVSFGWTGYSPLRLVIIRQALRYMAKTDGAYLCASGFCGSSLMAWAKKLL
jgi:hypothetical protein